MHSEPYTNTRKPKRKIVERYNRQNPPPDMEAAFKAIDELQLVSSSIEVQLKSEYSPHHTEAAYQEWRKRAMHAQASNEKEIRFLQEWIREKNRGLKKESPLSSSLDFEKAVQRVCARARELASEIEDGYVPQYNLDNKPLGIDFAQERMAELVAVKKRLEAAFAEISTLCANYGLPKDAVVAPRALLHEILSVLEAEIVVVRAVAHTGHNDASHYDERMCLGALIRAVGEGFQLTSKERVIFNRFCKFHKMS